MKRIGITSVLIAYVAVALVAQANTSNQMHSVELARGALKTALGDDALSAELVIIGESPHYTAEVPNAVVEILLPDLYEYGCRLYFVESCHAYSWIVDRYVTGESGPYSLPPSATLLSSQALSHIRASNLTQPVEERVHVGMIDVNHLQ